MNESVGLETCFAIRELSPKSDQNEQFDDLCFEDAFAECSHYAEFDSQVASFAGCAGEAVLVPAD